MIKVCLDFDGVLTSDPEAGREFILECLGSGYKVMVNSWRCENDFGVGVIEAWLREWLGPDDAERVSVPTTKPGADIYIDDKGFRFEGVYPSMEEIYELAEESRRLSLGT